MEEKIQTEKKDIVDMDLRISRITDCMRQVIQRNKLKMKVKPA